MSELSVRSVGVAGLGREFRLGLGKWRDIFERIQNYTPVVVRKIDLEV